MIVMWLIILICSIFPECMCWAILVSLGWTLDMVEIFAKCCCFRSLRLSWSFQSLSSGPWPVAFLLCCTPLVLSIRERLTSENESGRFPSPYILLNCCEELILISLSCWYNSATKTLDPGICSFMEDFYYWFDFVLVVRLSEYLMIHFGSLCGLGIYPSRVSLQLFCIQLFTVVSDEPRVSAVSTGASPFSSHTSRLLFFLLQLETFLFHLSEE